jgi:hypothetical protein
VALCCVARAPRSGWPARGCVSGRGRARACGVGVCEGGGQFVPPSGRRVAGRGGVNKKKREIQKGGELLLLLLLLLCVRGALTLAGARYGRGRGGKRVLVDSFQQTNGRDGRAGRARQGWHRAGGRVGRALGPGSRDQSGFGPRSSVGSGGQREGRGPKCVGEGGGCTAGLSGVVFAVEAKKEG